jgi:type III secretion protein HrpB1
LVADERIESTTNIILRLTFTEGEELVAQLDTIMLTPHSQITRVPDVPGTQLSIYADRVGAAGSKGALDVLIYGQY